MANINLHWLFMMGKLTNTAFPKRLSQIFLWEKFPIRAPIPIVNQLLKTFFVFGEQWGVPSYSDSKKYNTIQLRKLGKNYMLPRQL